MALADRLKKIADNVTEQTRTVAIRHALYQASLKMQEPLGLKERLDCLLHTAQTVLELERVNVLLADARAEWLEAVASLGVNEPLESIRVPTGPAGGALAEAYRTGQPIIWDGRTPLPPPHRLQPPYDQIEAFRSQVFAIVPLVIQGRAIGVLGVDRKRSRRPLDDATLEMLQPFATQAALAIEQARLYEQLQGVVAALKHAVDRETQLARTDTLTSLTNRRAFYELSNNEIERARRYHRPFTVAYLDLDNFKRVNDQFGHSTGDTLLRTVADIIKTSTRTVDVIARLGGDEFAILFPEMGPESGQAVSRKLHERLVEAMRQHEWPVTFSIGVMTFVRPPATVDQMIRLVDGLMYAAKNSGKNRTTHKIHEALDESAAVA